jgi:hypothetical protein
MPPPLGGIPMNLSKKTVLFYSHGGGHTYLAMRLAEDFGKVLFYTPNKGLYPYPAIAAIGKGLPGLTVIHSFEDHVEEADLFVFPYTGDGDIQKRLRAMGKRVFGSGDVEQLEQDRPKFKDVLSSRGLPTAPHKIFTGIESLRKIAKEDPGWWIKIYGEHSTYRALTETFFLDSYAKSANKLDNLAVTLGCQRDTWPFMGEKPLPGFETGSDRFFSGGVVLPQGMYGYELKNVAYVAKHEDVTKFPKHILTVNDAMAPVWKKYGLSGALSDEIRIHKGKPYCVDLTPRIGSPPGELMSRFVKNISHVVWACAGGEMITPEYISKYAVSINIKTHEAILGDVPLTVKDKDLNRVMLKCACKIGSQYYNILNPMDADDEEIATVIGFGDIIEEAQQECLENCEKIDAPGITYPADCFNKLDDVLEEAEKNGLGKF